MKKVFGLSFSQFLGCLLLVVIISEFCGLFYIRENWQFWLLCLGFYFCCLWMIEKVETIAFLASLDHKYSTAIFLTLVMFVFDIQRGYKKLKIYSLLNKGIDVERLSIYFDDKDNHVQYIALLLYADVMSINPVLQWFEEKYTKKNIPIDMYFMPIYKYCIEKQAYT